MADLIKEAFGETIRDFDIWFVMPNLIFLLVFLKNYLTKLYSRVII